MMHRKIILLVLICSACSRTERRTTPVPADRAKPVLEFRNGLWLGRRGFEASARFSVHGRLQRTTRERVDSVIDLAGAFVVPPFGEAHNHNVDFSRPARTDSLIARYLRDGVFYAINPANLPRTRTQLAGRVNVAAGIDAIFANGALIATDGHPMGLYRRNLAGGGMSVEDGEGAFFWTIDNIGDLDRKWPLILAGKPDFVKVMLLYSEEYEKRRNDTAHFNWKGVNPALIPEIVRRAHRAKLRVMAHVETAADFGAAVRGGVDLVGHTPGFRGNEKAQLPEPLIFRITEADARLAASRGTAVITTLGGIAAAPVDSPTRARFDTLAAYNLRVLKRAGVTIAIGSDNYRGDSSEEVKYIATLRVFSPLELTRLWSENTPSAIFPERRVGCLADGCEASFLALDGDPSLSSDNLFRVRLRVKDGRVLTPAFTPKR